MELPIHLFIHCCCRIYRLATTHFVTDGQTDRRPYHANSRSYWVQQYIRYAKTTARTWIWTSTTRKRI